MYKKQRGMTTIGMILAAAIAGLIVFAGLRLTPVYLGAMKVSGVLKSVHTEFNGMNPSVKDIKLAISRRMELEMLEAVSNQDFKVTKAGKGYLVKVVYSEKVPYIANISFVVDFEKSVEITR